MGNRTGLNRLILLKLGWWQSVDQRSAQLGARRRFSVTPREDSIKVIPEKLVTTQMSSRAQRSEVEKWLEEWYSSSHLSGIHLKSTLTSDRILNLYLMSLITAIYTAINN